MRIVNISHLFKTPVISSTEVQSQLDKSQSSAKTEVESKHNRPVTSTLQSSVQQAKRPDSTKRRRKRKRPSTKKPNESNDKVKLDLISNPSQQSSVQPAKQLDPVQNPDGGSKKRKRKRVSGKSNTSENKPKLQKTTRDISGSCDSTNIKPAEEVKQEITELKNSLLVLSSKKDSLERKLNELQEENNRLAKSNEELRDELQEMTEEALELSVEKQRLLGKIGSLKKQLLNKPK